MGAYAALPLLPLLWAAARANAAIPERPVRWLIILLLSLFIGLRREVGGDWDSYLILFHRAQSYGLLDALSLSDIGYMLSARLLGWAGLSVGALNLLFGTLFAAALIRFCATRPSPPLALLVAIPVLVVIVAMGFMRQGGAISLVMLALASWHDGRRRLPLLLIGAAPLVHWSAMLLLPLIAALPSGRPRNPWIMTGAGLAAGLLLVAVAAMSPYSAALGRGFSLGAVLRIVPSLVALFLFLLFHKRMLLRKDEGATLAFFCGIVGFTVPLLITAPVADRFNFYPIIFQMMIATNLVTLASSDSIRRLIGIAAALPSLILYGGWMTFSAYTACWSPYRSYLSAPRALLTGPVPDQLFRSGRCQIAKGELMPMR